MTSAAQYAASIQAMQWDELRSLWAQIQQRHTPDWASGKAFESLILRAFQLDGADVRYPYSVKLFDEEVEQIDGAIHCLGLSCLVESKDYTSKRVDIEPIAKLRNQLLRRPSSAIGSVFSRTGFTEPARQISHFTLSQTILLWHGEEVEYALTQEAICQFLVLKYRKSIEIGIPDYDIREVRLP